MLQSTITQRVSLVRLLPLLTLSVLLAACNDDSTSQATQRSPATGQASGTNAPPILQGTPARTVTAGEAYTYAPIASDPDGDPLTFSVTRKPSWAIFDVTTGRLSGTPQESDVGEYAGIAISANDGQVESMVGPFAVTVISATDPTPPPPPANSAPVISGSPTTSVVAGSSYAFTPTANDSDGDTLTFSIQNQPPWAAFDAATGSLSGTPGDSDAGAYSGIVISVSDGQADAALDPFTIVVEPQGGGTPPPTNTPPTISGTAPGSVFTGDSYAFVPGARDADGDALTFSIRNKPAWASFSATSGRLSGRPSSSAVGTYSGIEISVSDGTDTAVLPAFSIAVLEPPNAAPTISGSPSRTVTAGTSYGFTPTASDADGDALTFSVQNRPSWANFSTSTGRLSGTPTASDVGSYSNIVIRVSDGTDSAALPAFSIDVREPANTAPVISGNPSRAVTAGTSYGFTPTASDADGDTLTFSISNKPSWANFSTSTGRLSGTPQAADAGTYSNIVISVSDGSDSASLAAFSVTVEQVSTGSVTLSWTAPTQNTDGSALTDLAGYRIVYGKSSGNLDQQVQLMNPGLTTAVVDNLAAGTWYFAVKALNSASVESDLSNIASKAIP